MFVIFTFLYIKTIYTVNQGFFFNGDVVSKFNYTHPIFGLGYQMIVIDIVNIKIKASSNNSYRTLALETE